MNAGVATRGEVRTSDPRMLARLTGLFFLLTTLAGVIAQVTISQRLIVSTDADATATNILSQEGLFQLGFTIYLVEMASQVITTVLFYQLLRPVNGTVALAAALLQLTGVVIKAFARVFYIAPLFVLQGPAALHGFSPEQLQSLTLVLLSVNDAGAAMALAFFGFSTILNGYLIFRSAFLPRWLGVLSVVAGFGWLTFLYPPLGHGAFTVVALLGLIGSVATILWFLFVGVNDRKWKEQLAAIAPAT